VAKTVYDTEEIELQDGAVVTIRPLNIKLLREFMEVVSDLGTGDDELENMDKLVTACGIALKKQLPDLVANREKLEEALDIPTIWKILEIAGGIKMGDPNLLAAAVEAGRV
jgi:hypothetical protein